MYSMSMYMFLVRVSYFFLVGVPCFGSCFVSVFVSDLVAAGVLPVAPPFCAFWAAAFCSFSSCPAPANIFTNSTEKKTKFLIDRKLRKGSVDLFFLFEVKIDCFKYR